MQQNERGSDLTGDGLPDLLTVGAQNGLPAGLSPPRPQLRHRHRAGRRRPHGRRRQRQRRHPLLPAPEFTGAQATAGHFTGSGLNEVLAYYPTRNNAGAAVILTGNGNGQRRQQRRRRRLHPPGHQRHHQHLFAGSFIDTNGDIPSGPT